MPDSLSQSIKQKLNGITKDELLESLKELPARYTGTEKLICELGQHW